MSDLLESWREIAEAQMFRHGLTATNTEELLTIRDSLSEYEESSSWTTERILENIDGYLTLLCEVEPLNWALISIWERLSDRSSELRSLEKGQAISELKTTIDSYVSSSAEAQFAIAERLKSLVPERANVLVPAISSTVYVALDLCANSGKTMTIHVPFFYPTNGGAPHFATEEHLVEFWSRLRRGSNGEERPNVTFVTLPFSSMGNLIGEMSVILSGAHAVTRNKCAINREGIRSIESIAEEIGVPHFVLCASSKVCPFCLEEGLRIPRGSPRRESVAGSAIVRKWSFFEVLAPNDHWRLLTES